MSTRRALTRICADLGGLRFFTERRKISPRFCLVRGSIQPARFKAGTSKSSFRTDQSVTYKLTDSLLGVIPADGSDEHGTALATELK